MVFINKIAYVVHDCVENWLLEENGQCNKNLGRLFLLVFYIEDDAKLRRKLENAINDFWDGKKNEVEKAVELSGTRLCSLVIRILSLCFRLFLKRFCPPPGALKGELGNTSSKGGTVRYSDIAICHLYPLATMIALRGALD